MKYIYCKFCGLELEDGSCNCNQFLNSINKVNISHKKDRVHNAIVCDSCKKAIDSDSIYCPYCGLPINVDGNNTELREELIGKNSIDVIDFYKSQDKKLGIKNNSLNDSKIKFIVILSLSILIISYALFSLIVPFIKQKIINNQIKKELMNSETYDSPFESSIDTSLYETTIIEETSQQKIDFHNKWVKQDGYFYAFDKNGDPVIDDWVTETDENGIQQKYYFDVDGRLVVDSWIDGEYYVGADGAMLKGITTPDGAVVDEDGRVLLNNSDGVPVELETNVYYESPNSEAETAVVSKQKSSNSGEIRGVDPNKKYELYVKTIIQQRETITKGDLRCNIIYYLPVIEGAKEKEVKNINEALKEKFNEFKDLLVKTAKESTEIPKSITFNVVEQRTLNSNRMNIIVHGKIYPRHGLVEKKKYRFIYDRKSKKVTLKDIIE